MCMHLGKVQVSQAYIQMSRFHDAKARLQFEAFDADSIRVMNGLDAC